MRFIDLSQPVFHECPNSPADPPVQSEIIADHDKGEWRVEKLTLTTHTGSHIDAPLHKRAHGSSIDMIPLTSFAGWAVVADMREARPGMPFTSSWLARKLRVELEDRIVLLATGWGQKRARTREWLEELPFVSPDGAEWLVEQQVRGVGIDHHSIGGVREIQNQLTHEILLDAGIWIVEDLLIPEEVFTLPQPLSYWGLPINLKGFSGAFCRPVLVVG